MQKVVITFPRLYNKQQLQYQFFASPTQALRLFDLKSFLFSARFALITGIRHEKHKASQ